MFFNLNFYSHAVVAICGGDAGCTIRPSLTASTQLSQSVAATLVAICRNSRRGGDASCSLRRLRWWRGRVVWPPPGRRIGVASEVLRPSSLLSVSAGGTFLSSAGGVEVAFGRMHRGPHLHRRPRVHLRLRLDVDATLHDSRRWHVCSGGQFPMANIATDCEVALHVSDFMPGRILLRCKLRPRSPGHGPQLACKISPQLGCDLGLQCLDLRLRLLLLLVIGTVLPPLPLSPFISGGHSCC